MILTTADAVESASRELQVAYNKKSGSRSSSSSSSADQMIGDDGNKGVTPQSSFSGNKPSSYKRKNIMTTNGDNDDEEAVVVLPDLEVVGPEGITTFLHSLRHFMRRDRFKVHSHEGHYDSCSADNNGTVSASRISNKRKSAKKKKKCNGGNGGGGGGGDCEEIGFNVKSIPISYDDHDDDDDASSDNLDHADQQVRSSQTPTRLKQAVSYLFTTPPIPGKFLIDKAQALGVPRGPLYAQLKSGKSVTFLDTITNLERTVLSEEVIARRSPGVGVAIVYCPNLSVLNELKESNTFRALESGLLDGNVGSDDEVKLDVMVHLSPKHIFYEPLYQSWCKMFGSNVDHLTLHSSRSLDDLDVDEENSPFVSGIISGIQRSFVNDTVFPMPILSASEMDGNEEVKCSSKDDVITIKGCPMMSYTLLPRSRRGLDGSTVSTLYPTNTIDNLRQEVNETGAVECASSIVSSHRTRTFEKSGCIGELIFAGTGSALPSKQRNVTGKYLRMNNGNSLLLDVGEGTIGQLLRSWKSTLSSTESTPIEEYRSRIQGIKAVWISHPHADHHLGILRLLSERIAICGTTDPIVLMAPSDLFAFLEEYEGVVPDICQSFISVDCAEMIHGQMNPMSKKLFEDLGITNCMSIPVSHCARSYAVVMDGTSFGRLGYSGDCRPSKRFADVAFGADLLIHEATFEDGMEEDAVLKRHSTVGEAIYVATEMNAKSLALTHFSQRYPKIPQMKKTTDGDKESAIPIVFAFDYMRLTPNTFELAAKLTPALRMLYPGDESETLTEHISAKEILGVPGLFASTGVL